MATATRQPFAPLDGARLQTLTSLKNRQNAVPSPSGGKRKADLVESDDFENVDPLAFNKRAKGTPSGNDALKDVLKPSAFVLTKAPVSTPVANVRTAASLASPTKASFTSPRRMLQARSPIARLNTSSSLTKSSPIAAPAGRSPTRGKRSGILSSRRKTAGPYSRVEPPSFNLGGAAPFSLDAALKGTIPSYGSRPAAKLAPVPAAAPPLPSLTPLDALPDAAEADMKASWFFDIHEDTPEQEMTNLLQHSTCVLDISSDEESERKATRERAEGRDKENVPPVDDVSQTSRRAAAVAARQAAEDDMLVEKERVALGEMNRADFYALGYDESSVIIVPGDDEAEEPQQQAVQQAPAAVLPPIVDGGFEFAPDLKSTEVPQLQAEEQLAESVDLPTQVDIDVLMSRDADDSKASLLQPMNGTGESFELWESDSTRDEAEAEAPQTPRPIEAVEAPVEVAAEAVEAVEAPLEVVAEAAEAVP